VQDLGLAGTNALNDEVRLFCGVLDGLAFLPVADVPAGMQLLRGAITVIIISFISGNKAHKHIKEKEKKQQTTSNYTRSSANADGTVLAHRELT